MARTFSVFPPLPLCACRVGNGKLRYPFTLNQENIEAQESMRGW